MPQLNDPNFARSVVLMLHHDADGAMGLVVNNPSDLDLGTFSRSQNMTCHASLESLPVFRGGPVEPERGWILHSNTSVTERKEIVPGVFLSGSPDTLKNLLAGGLLPFRLILGYAGWDAGQLEGEMAAGAWLTAKADPKHILQTDPGGAWVGVLKDMGVDPSTLAVAPGIH